MSSITAISLQQELERLDHDFEHFSQAANKLTELILERENEERTVLDRPGEFYGRLTEFERAIITSPSITQALLASNYVRQALQLPPPSKEKPQGQPAEPQPSPTPLTKPIALTGVAFATMLVLAVKKLIPVELMVAFAFLTVFLCFLPYIPNLKLLLERRRVAREDGEALLRPRTAPEWVSSQINRMRIRYKAERFLILRTPPVTPSQLPGFENYPETVLSRKLQRLETIMADFTAIIGNITIYVNEAVREQKNLLTSQLAAAGQPVTARVGVR